MYNERAELLDVYRATPLTLRTLARGLDDGAVRQRPGTDEWSIIEIVTHLADAEERAFDRVERMLREDGPALPGYDPAQLAASRDYGSLSLAGELDRFESIRSEHVARLESLDGAAWSRTGMHEEVGEITVQALTAHMAAHDSAHLAQIAGIIQPRSQSA